MAPQPRAITAKSLQTLLTRIGSASSGTKATLQQRFARDIYRSRMFARRPSWQDRRKLDWGRKLRIVSIDMGIKNLAYCDVEVDFPNEGDLRATMDVIRWEVVDLVKSTRNFRGHLPSPRDIKKGSVDDDEDVDPYSLDVLSTTAVNLIRRTILTGEPDIILIEKQRWRSGGGSAVQQWTVRVNTLEGMLWAVLDSLRTEWQVSLARKSMNRRDYEVFSVDPKRVGHYWLGEKESALAAGSKQGSLKLESEDSETLSTSKAKVTKTKAEKKAKIDILRSWLSTSPPSTSVSMCPNTPRIEFLKDARVESIFQAVTAAKKAPRKRKTKAEASEEDEAAEETDTGVTKLKKLDDVTDCMLQAAAWVSWELNRLQLVQIEKSVRDEDANEPRLGDKVLRAMAEETGMK